MDPFKGAKTEPHVRGSNYPKLWLGSSSTCLLSSTFCPLQHCCEKKSNITNAENYYFSTYLLLKGISVIFNSLHSISQVNRNTCDACTFSTPQDINHSSVGQNWSEKLLFFLACGLLSCVHVSHDLPLWDAHVITPCIFWDQALSWRQQSQTHTCSPRKQSCWPISVFPALKDSHVHDFNETLSHSDLWPYQNNVQPCLQ